MLPLGEALATGIGLRSGALLFATGRLGAGPAFAGSCVGLRAGTEDAAPAALMVVTDAGEATTGPSWHGSPAMMMNLLAPKTSNCTIVLDQPTAWFSGLHHKGYSSVQ